jgi:negative regulator of sigma E activity
MRRLGRSLLPALVISQLWAGTALAETLEQAEALAWLQKIAQAARDLNYRGTFVYQHGEHAETSRITHLAQQQRDPHLLRRQAAGEAREARCPQAVPGAAA